MRTSTARRITPRPLLQLVRRSTPRRFGPITILSVIILILVACLFLYMIYGARLLIVDKPRPADVILVLGGDEEARSQRAIELLRQGYATRTLIDTSDWTVWGIHSTDLARNFINTKPDVA